LSELLLVEVANVFFGWRIHDPVIVVLRVVGVEEESLTGVPSSKVAWLVVTIRVEA